jgi:aminoglycoside phosphotransferase family enzyme
MLPGIEQKVAFLRKSEIYPLSTRSVEAKETHMSWVFLTDTHAWKLKKPVRTHFLDFSTPEARHHDCNEEVRLNRRLAPGVYEGVVPLTLDEQGSLELGGKGMTVDWLVRMRRLPSDHMLDHAIACHSSSDEDIRKIGVRLAEFYAEASPVPLTGLAYRMRLTVDVRVNRCELRKAEYSLPVDLVECLTSRQLAFLRQNAELFDDRVRAGKIVEAHGDLRPEHICLGTEPVIIDCLEFNRDLRILDSASELMFLALECERLGSAPTGALILNAYCRKSGDDPPPSLLAFYKSYHACLRAKVGLWHLKDVEVRDAAHWLAKGRDYLELAAGSLGQPVCLGRSSTHIAQR